MYELPGSDSTGKVVITADVVRTGAIPQVIPVKEPKQNKSA
jgi:ATP-dependent protease Clp ATPase subunit